MKYLVRFLFVLGIGVGFFLASSAQACEHPLHDQIHSCDFANDTACARQVLDQILDIALAAPSAPGMPSSGAYTSEQFSMTISVVGNRATISGESNISERGEYTCDGAGSCAGDEYSFIVEGPTSIKMSYGRVWTRQ